ncbi:uncharacterized protein RSE6_02911 [Rhynchosporium secalis]|uniref:Uncharacterized protein n=1 Tax=Rhynchosporium secalis TaxID=38038 RepID=A0A1E1M1G6_RHYSE|nr:uncharacterized protein RSE6_02911 [Rhynchosporium secalis]
MKDSGICMEDNDSAPSTTDGGSMPCQSKITPQTSGTSTPNTIEGFEHDYEKQFGHGVLDDDYFTEILPKDQAEDPDAIRGVIDEVFCSILPQRRAVWTEKHTKIKLSSLAAATLVDAMILRPKDLSVSVSPSSEHCDVYIKNNTDRASYPPRERTPPFNPTDPISGMISAAHGTVGGIVMGIADYPVEITKMVKADHDVAAGLAKDFALDSGKGISRIVGTGLKAPMDMALNISRGFGNVPRLYGDKTVRKEEKVTGVVSGLGAAGKGFGLGLFDGITGLITQPMEGAKKGGLGGFFAGVGMGLGGVVCKPTAGAVGLAAYTFKGVYEEVKNQQDDYSERTQMADGLRASKECSEADRLIIIDRWYELSQFARIGDKSKWQ